jgi:hypothetical protein
MATTVALNHFVRASVLLTTTLTQVYSAPANQASIVLTALATNTTSSPQTITLGVSGNGGTNQATLPYFDIVKNFQIPANDTANLAIGKIVLNNYDALYASAQTLSAINVTLSVLETLNTQ